MPKMKLVAATILLCILPAIAFGSGSLGFQLIAASTDITTASPDTIREVADSIAGKSVAYWFITLAGISIASWTWVFKWLINQLDSQRTANAALSDRLIKYMESDRTSLLNVLQDVSNLLKVAVDKLTNLPH